MERSVSTPEDGSRRRSLWFAAAIVCLFITSLSAIRELYRQHAIRDEITSLEQHIAQLEQRKTGISDLLIQLNTPSSLDREARLRLGMQKPGERVFVLQGDRWQEASARGSVNAPVLFTETPEQPLRSNPHRWARYFFTHSS